MQRRGHAVVALAAALLWSGAFPAAAQIGETQSEPWMEGILAGHRAEAQSVEP